MLARVFVTATCPSVRLSVTSRYCVLRVSITWKDSRCTGKEGLGKAYELMRARDPAKRVDVLMGLCCSRGTPKAPFTLCIVPCTVWMPLNSLTLWSAVNVHFNLWRPLLPDEWPDVKNYKWRLNPVWHRMLYSCTHMAAVGVKGLTCAHCCSYVWPNRWAII